MELIGSTQFGDLSKQHRADFIQGEAVEIGVGTAAMIFCRGAERLGSTLNTPGQVGIYN